MFLKFMIEKTFYKQGFRAKSNSKLSESTAPTFVKLAKSFSTFMVVKPNGYDDKILVFQYLLPVSSGIQVITKKQL